MAYMIKHSEVLKAPETLQVSASAPIGGMLSHGSSTPPQGWLVCDGSAVSRTAYAELFAVIGTTYGAGNGTTTFNLPNDTNAIHRRFGIFSSAYTSGDTAVVAKGSELTIWDGSRFVECYDAVGATVTDGTGNSTVKYLYASANVGGITWSLSATAPVWSDANGQWTMNADLTKRWVGWKLPKSGNSTFIAMYCQGKGAGLVHVNYMYGVAYALANLLEQSNPATATRYAIPLTTYALDVSPYNLASVSIYCVIINGSTAQMIDALFLEANASTDHLAYERDYYMASASRRISRTLPKRNLTLYGQIAFTAGTPTTFNVALHQMEFTF